MNTKANKLYDRVRAQEALMVFDVQFATAFGLEAGIFLSRLIYFCRPESRVGKEIDGERWYYSTYANWISNSFPWMAERTLRRMVIDLEDRGLIISTQEKSVNRQKYYRPDFDVIWDKLMEKFPDVYTNVDRPSGQIGQVKSGQNGRMLINSKSLTVTTSSDEDVIAEPDCQNDADRYLTAEALEEVKPKRKQNPMFNAVAEVCVMDPALVGSRIAKAARALEKAGYTPQQVLAFTSYWQKTSFQYRQDKKPPTPEQLIAQIKQSLTQQQSKEKDPDYYSTDQLTLAEREERRKNNGRAKTVQGLYGPPEVGEDE